jgi:hypothetical protein
MSKDRNGRPITKSYYSVSVYSLDTPRTVKGVHIIKAISVKDALRIREKFGISNPWGATGELRINCHKIKLKKGLWKEENTKLLDRRRKGLGGNIWYEDKNGELRIEL